MRSPSAQGARRSAPSFLNNAGVLEQYVDPNYVEQGEQAQRNGGPIACFGRQVMRNAARPLRAHIRRYRIERRQARGDAKDVVGAGPRPAFRGAVARTRDVLRRHHVIHVQ